MIKNKNVLKRYSLPDKVKFCKKCIISNQRPRITFDENGICSACNFAEMKKNKFDWVKREEELIKLLDKHRRNDGRYDVIVPCSGGKDAAYIAHQLKHKYKMNPLTVTWAPHLYTNIGFENLHNMTRTGDVSNILFTPPGKTHRKLTKLSFEVLGDPFQPFIYGQYNYPLHASVMYNIPLVMYGENGEVEYGGAMKNAYKPTRDYRGDQKKHYFSNLGPEEFTKYGIDQNDLWCYLPPKLELLDNLKAEIHFYSYYKKWIPQENFYYCVENTGFKPNPVRSEGTYSKYASLDDQLDGFHYYLAYIKFGLGRATSDAAHEIRDGHLTRDEGIQLVNKFDGEFPKKYFQTFLDYCDIDKDYFDEVIDSWRSPHLWRKNDKNEWELIHRLN
jgi:N-acetyl sugar amidotransferase